MTFVPAKVVPARWFLAVLVLWLGSAPAGAQAAKPDRFAAVRFLVGEWEGKAEGASGLGTVRRTYSFVLKDRYLYETNVSTYAPKEEGKAGEVHEHWSFFSYDRGRSSLVLRQFHQEGFVNQYVMLPAAEGAGGRLVFESEGIENFDPTWKARETYEILSPDEFVEIFELIAPGKPPEVYSRNTFKRVKAGPGA